LKWIRILFRCWQAGTPYQEGTYLRAVEKRCHIVDRQPRSDPHPSSANPATSPSSANPSADPRVAILSCGSTVELQLKNVAGFWKIFDAKA